MCTLGILSGRRLSEASAELIIWQNVCRLCMVKSTTDVPWSTPTLEISLLSLCSLEIYLENTYEHTSSSLFILPLFWLQLRLWKRWPSGLVGTVELNRHNAQTSHGVISVIYYNSNWSMGITWIKAQETYSDHPSPFPMATQGKCTFIKVRHTVKLESVVKCALFTLESSLCYWFPADECVQCTF